MKFDELDNILISFLEEYAIEKIGDDILFVNDVHTVPILEYPIKPGVIMCILCNSGYAEGSVNMRNWRFESDSLHVVQPEQRFQYYSVSGDFSASIFFLSLKFITSLELKVKESTSTFIYLRDNPVMAVKPVEKEFQQNYYTMLHAVAKMHDNPYQLEMARYLFQIFFYATTNFEHFNNKENKSKSRVDVYFEMFHNMLLKFYRQSREVSFYAEKLRLNSKYLSTIIKEATGKSASEWIDGYVILEAKSMLKSKEMTIQEISDYLWFTDQSAFGKYFKRNVGVSPKEYR